MAETRRCPQCGGALAADAPEGLCPRCLLKEGVRSTLAADAPEGSAASRVGFVPPEPAEIAEHFPQLEVMGLLGRGGMGVVYKARQPGLDRFVALKILPPDIGADPTFAERFAREARSLARLNHPNIVAVYDFGLAGGFFYFLMEYVDGVSLRQMEQTQRVSPKQALAIVPQICDALQYAHDEGIVHRDIKPENILIDTKGRVKIADFGLAKLLARGPTDYTLTLTQQTMGTIHYMAPEQMERPGEVDHRADIYSLGVVFYEMLTGELPLGSFAPPSRKVRVDVRLDEVVLRAMAREPELRYQRASEVRSDVDSIASGLPTGPPAAAIPGAALLETDLQAIRHQVRGPANALLAAGLIVVASVIPGILLLDVFRTIGDGGMILLVVLLLLAVPVAALAILGAVGLRRGHSYGLAVTGCILVMIPLTPGWLLSLPLGIWVLLALRRPDVKAAFGRRPRAGVTVAPGRPSPLPRAGAAIQWEQPRPEYVGPTAAPGEPADVESARRKVQGPAIGLLVVGILNGLGMVLAFVAIPYVLLEDSPELPDRPPAGMPTRVPARQETGVLIEHSVRWADGPAGPARRISASAQTAPGPPAVPIAASAEGRARTGMSLVPFWLSLFGVAAGVLQIATAALIILGAVRMRKLGSYGLAMTASILAMLPCTYAFPIGIPIGIWALVVLTKPEVKAAFALKRRGGRVGY